MLVFDKILEGATIFLSGVGNTARYSKGEIEEAVVIKVNPKSVVLKIGNNNRETKLYKHCNQNDYGNHLEDGSNGGYGCYYSKLDIIMEKEAHNVIRAIQDAAMRGGNSISRVDTIMSLCGEYKAKFE